MNNENEFLECKKCGIKIQVHTRLIVRPEFRIYPIDYCPHCFSRNTLKEISYNTFNNASYVLFTRVKRLYVTKNHIKKLVSLSIKFRC